MYTLCFLAWWEVVLVRGFKSGEGGRPAGAEACLWKLTYSQIANWSGVSNKTIRNAVWRKEFDPRDIESVLRWVNRRRLRRGLGLVGEVGDGA